LFFFPDQVDFFLSSFFFSFFFFFSLGMSVSADRNSRRFRFLVVGDEGVGKTALLARLETRTFASDTREEEKDFSLCDAKIDDQPVRLQVWERPTKFCRSIAYYRGAHGFAIAFDVTNGGALEQIDHWVEQIDRKSNSNSNVPIPILLIATKCDLVEQRSVSRQAAQACADRHGLAYYETSAKTGAGVDDAFHALTRQVLAKPAPSPLGRAPWHCPPPPPPPPPPRRTQSLCEWLVNWFRSSYS